MNVGDLKQMLEGVPDDVPVVVKGYEMGMDSLKAVRRCYTTPYYDGAWYDGGFVHPELLDDEGSPRHRALLLSRAASSLEDEW